MFQQFLASFEPNPTLPMVVFGQAFDRELLVRQQPERARGGEIVIDDLETSEAIRGLKGISRILVFITQRFSRSYIDGELEICP